MLPPLDPVLEESQRAAVKQYPVPAFGHTRCYWSLLDSELRYLYLDPASFAHMGDQAAALIGTCLLDYVHPDEHRSARADLRNVLDSRTLHGSVTRVRYARLSRIRAILGCNTPEPFPDADLVTVDDHYIACDVVINWVSDNVVLCFLHAIVDKGKADNDEQNKTHWTNWCGTAAMTIDHATELHNRLQRLVPPSRSPPDRIFQILINQPARPVLFSWPPEGYTASEFGKLVHTMQIDGPDGHDHPKSDDGAKTSCTRRYKANQQITVAGALKEVESIFIPHGAVIFACHKVASPKSPYPDAQHARANAPGMYQSYQSRPQPSSRYPPQLHQQPVVQGHYESDVRRSTGGPDYSASGVPGSPEYAHPRTTSSGYERGPAEYGGSQYGMRDMDYAHGPNYVQYNSPYPMPSNQQRNEVYAPAQPHAADHRNIPGRPEGWEYSQAQAAHAPAQPPWPATSSPRPTSPRSRGPSTYDGQPWMMPQGWPQGTVEPPPQQQGYPYPSQSFGPPPLPPQQQPLSPPPPYAPNTPVSQPPPHLEPLVQPKREQSTPDIESAIPRTHAVAKRKRDSVPKGEMNGSPSLLQGETSPPSKEVIARERGHSTGAPTPRVGGAPPPGIARCSSCKSETSPEWRKGPSGKKDLCNACGLRYARSKQKRDGLGPPKRRREKEIPLAPAPAPATSSPHPNHGHVSASASTSSSSTGPSWPSALGDSRDPKRVRSDAFTTPHSPSSPRSESRSQGEHYPDTYPGRYGQPVYQGYPNGYGMDYGRIPGPMPSYVTPELSSSDRAFPGQ